MHIYNLPDWDFFERNWTLTSWNKQGVSPLKTQSHRQCEMPGHNSTKRRIHSWYGLIPYRAFRIAFEGTVVVRLASRFEGSCSYRWLALVFVVASSWCQWVFMEWILMFTLCRQKRWHHLEHFESINQDDVFAWSLTLIELDWCQSSSVKACLVLTVVALKSALLYTSVRLWMMTSPVLAHSRAHVSVKGSRFKKPWWIFRSIFGTHHSHRSQITDRKWRTIQP